MHDIDAVGMALTGAVWRMEMPKTGEDEGGWYRTQTWLPSWPCEKKIDTVVYVSIC